MNDYHEKLREHARIAILRLLEAAPEYTSNVWLMTDQLRSCGIGFSRDQVTGEIAWLAEQGLAVQKDIAGFTVAVATQRGVEVARGILVQPGVPRPRPGA